MVADFLSPNKIRGQRLLKRGKNMWFSSPNASKAVPISQRQRLSGGASNGDVASTNYARDYEIVSVTDESIDGKATRRFELRSKDSSVTYDQVRYWIDTKAKVGVKAEFLSKTGKLLKTAAFQYGNKIQYEGDTTELQRNQGRIDTGQQVCALTPGTSVRSCPQPIRLFSDFRYRRNRCQGLPINSASSPPPACSS